MEHAPPFLIQKNTGRLFVWTETLAKRDDMRPCDGDLPAALCAEPASAPAKQIEVEGTPESAESRGETTEPLAAKKPTRKRAK